MYNKYRFCQRARKNYKNKTNKKRYTAPEDSITLFLVMWTVGAIFLDYKIRRHHYR